MPRPRKMNKTATRTTVVADTEEQMSLLESLGYTHAEAYRLGSRTLTKDMVKQ